MATTSFKQNINKGTSEVNGIVFPSLFSNNETFIHQSNFNKISSLKFRIKVMLGYLSAYTKLIKTMFHKKCYIGPFKGEFGHFLAHILPFIMYLYNMKVKIIYCGMELHKPFLVDEDGNSIIYDFRPLRDFFAEIAPNSNSAIPPLDVQAEIKKFEHEAIKSGKAFWNIGDDYYYWFIHRNWLGKGYTHLYDISKVYKTKDENAVCLFPRNKGAKSTHNNGDAWDYQKLIAIIKPYVDKVYVLGHPSQSFMIDASDKVEVRITTDNAQILEACSNSKLIITQHSGVNNLGEYLCKQVLIIYKGGNKVSDIGSMNNTMRFRNFLGEKIPLNFAFTEEQVEHYMQQLQ